MRARWLSFQAGFVLAAPLALAAPPHWAQWRGPDGQGIASDPGVLLEWSPTKNVLWKTAIPGRGYSSPVVWGDRIFLTTAIEGDVVPGAKAVKHTMEGQEFTHPDGVGADRQHTFKLLALDAASGRILWESAAWEGTPYDTRHRRGSFAAPTPVSDGTLVYAYFGAEGLYAYGFDGTLKWSWKTGGIASFGVGVGTSPVLHGEIVIVQCDEDNGEKSFIVGLDRKTGKEVWRTPRNIEVSWATPILVKSAGRDELVTAGNQAIIGYDPTTGRELWRMKGLASNAVPSPVAGDGIVVLSAGYPTKLAVAVRPGGTGDVTETDRVLWKYDKGTAYVPSPILVDGLLYLVTDKGLISCLDAKTGKVHYEGGRPPVGASYMASPIAVAGHLLLSSMDGDTLVLKAGTTHEIVRSNPLGEPIAASPAVVAGRIYIRGEHHLFAIGAP
ncbi:MAG TPA: PQQ-binding-like beta-propeller repeat protein [Acidimicrobiales bacterium]